MTDYLDAINSISHRRSCPVPRSYTQATGTLGDTITRCTGCDRFTVTGATATNRRAYLGPAEMVSRWRCRIHTDEPVTPRGKGCRHCEKPRPARQPNGFDELTKGLS